MTAKLKLWEYFKAEEEGKQIQIQVLLSEKKEWVSWRLDADTGVYITEMIEDDRLRIKPEPIRLTVMVKKTYIDFPKMLIKEMFHSSYNWENWTEATFKDGKLVVEVSEDG